MSPSQFHETEDQKRWAQLGHMLRMKNRKQFRRVLALVESMVQDNDDEPISVDVSPRDARPPSRK